VRDDIQLVRLFLSRYQDSAGNSYRLAERPDVVERNAPAIEAVACDAHGHRLAVEHTLIQPFEGQKSDDLPFLKGFERLRLDDSRRVPDRLIEVIPPAFAIPRGFDWDAVGQMVHDWFRDARLACSERTFTLKLLPLGRPRTDNPRIVLAKHQAPPKLAAHSRTSIPAADDR